MGERYAAIATCVAVLLPALCSSAAAQGLVQSQPDAAWFGGVGATFNATSLDQDIHGSGSTNVFSGGVLNSIGTSSGPPVGFHGSDNSIGPQVQLGYFEHFTATDWLWGFKLSYQYEAARTSYDADITQNGVFDVVAGGTQPFVGSYDIGSSQTRIRHQISLFPFLGHSFANGFLYGGGGPMLVDVQSKLKNAVGFAEISGASRNITGTMNLEGSSWVWGAGAQAGMTYFLGSSWFLDLNYTYSRTQRFSESLSTPFANAFDIGGGTFTTSGVANFSLSDRITTQSVSISINKAF